VGRPRTVTDDAILQAARAVFLEEGPSASTNTIAERIGLSQAALFKRFGTKQDLMVAAMLPPSEPPFIPLIAGGPDPEAPIDVQLKALGRQIVSFFQRMVPCLMVLKSSGLDMHAMLERFDEPPPVLVRRILTGWFEQAMDAGRIRRTDPLAITSAFLGGFHLQVFMAHVTGAVSSEDEMIAFADTVVDTLWRGLAPEEAP